MGRARHPYDPTRPEPASVIRAIENNDIEDLKRRLSVRQNAFAHEYVVDFDGKAAAIRAGYSTKNPDKQAHLLLRHRGVAFLIEHLSRSKAAKITAVDPDYVIARVTEIISKDGTRDGDKLRGLELLARHLGMFVDRTEITGKDGEAIKIEQQAKEEAEGLMNTLRRIADKNKKEVHIP